VRVLLFGASGSIGQALAAELRRRGVDCVAVRRPGAAPLPGLPGLQERLLPGFGEPALLEGVWRGERFDTVVSCLASRSGVPADAWAVDHDAHQALLRCALRQGAERFVQLSAICVQKPQLAFQQAKRAFERSLMASELDWAIVRPTAYFKSLSGQLARVRQGRPFLVFGNGRQTACKPISDADLARYLADTLAAPGRRLLPVGGPGPAITPRDQAALLATLLGRPVHCRSLPPWAMDGIVAGLDGAARLHPPLAAKAALARIGRYYARESMLLWDAAAQRYDAEATPATGRDTLADHYAGLLQGRLADARGAHAVF
jgi:divinyl chlorophyllide a 8-vinyl-reductase